MGILDKGIRIWRNDLKEMFYIPKRYSLCYPAYKVPFASVLNGNVKVENREFMLAVTPDIINTDGSVARGIYEKDFINFSYKGKEESGVVEYYEDKMTWVVKNKEHIIPLYAVGSPEVIGNVYEGPNRT